MQEIIYWLFERISDVVSFSLNFKVLGNLSLLHFVLGFNFLMLFLGLLSFGFGFTPSAIRMSQISYRNAENKKERENYYHETVSKRRKDGSIVKSSYKINKKTGEVQRI